MSKQREALKKVRDRFFPANQPERDRDILWDEVNEALAEQEQEPVANMTVEGGRVAFAAMILPDGVYDLYTHPAPANQQAGVPDGYKLVPVEPTQAMLDAAERASMRHMIDCINDPKFVEKVGSEEYTRKTWASRYKSMLAAAPEAPAPAHIGSLCIKPACGEACTDCNSAISHAKETRYAIRYAYLRERDLDAIVDGGVFAGKVPENLVLNGADLDDAIDAALRAKNGATK